MPRDYREGLGDEQEALRIALESLRTRIWTALPGIVQAFDPATCTAVVQPAMQGTARAPDGARSALGMPVIPDVPVVFPAGGPFMLSLPVAAGDDCLLVFASRCIDGWWATGEPRQPRDRRMHDLSDAFAIVGPFATPRVPSGGVSATDAVLGRKDGTVSVAIGADGVIRLLAPAGVAITGNVTVTGDVVASGKSLVHHVHAEHDGGNTAPPA